MTEKKNNTKTKCYMYNCSNQSKVYCIWLTALSFVWSVLQYGTHRMQGATKVLSDSPGLMERLVGLVFSHRSLPDWQAPSVLLF